MAEVLASLKKIGGNGEQYTETSLWTNPNTSVDFATQNVTLSDSISNYKYIKFVYLIAKGGTVEMDLYVATDKLRTTTNANGAPALGLNSFGTSSGNLYPWSRVVYYVSDTSIHFNPARTVNAAITQDQRLIPKEILGINELAYRPDDYIVQSGTYSIASTNTPVTVTIGFKPKKLTTWRIGGTTTFESFTYDDRISETTYDRLMAFSGGINGATRTIGQSQTNELVSINNDGFTVATGGVTGTWNYIAVGVKE